MDYQRMANEYLEEAARLDRRLEQLRRTGSHWQQDLCTRMGHLMEVRDDLRVTGHLLQRRAQQAQPPGG